MSALPSGCPWEAGRQAATEELAVREYRVGVGQAEGLGPGDQSVMGRTRRGWRHRGPMVEAFSAATPRSLNFILWAMGAHDVL